MTSNVPTIAFQDITYDKNADRLTIVVNGEAKALAKLEQFIKDELDPEWTAGWSPVFSSRQFEITFDKVSDHCQPTWSDPHSLTSPTILLGALSEDLKDEFTIHFPMLEYADKSDAQKSQIFIRPVSDKIAPDIAMWLVNEATEKSQKILNKNSFYIDGDNNFDDAPINESIAPETLLSVSEPNYRTPVRLPDKKWSHIKDLLKQEIGMVDSLASIMGRAI